MAKQTKEKKYRHVTVGRLYEMKEKYIAEQTEKHPERGDTILIGSLWIQEFIQYVKKNKNT